MNPGTISIGTLDWHWMLEKNEKESSGEWHWDFELGETLNGAHLIPGENQKVIPTGRYILLHFSLFLLRYFKYDMRAGGCRSKSGVLANLELMVSYALKDF